MSNENLHSAMKNKKDEFYTLYEDIEKELSNYVEFLKNKIVYCNCDDYKMSNFYKYFKNNFSNLRLKKLVATCYTKNGRGLKAEYNGVKENVSTLEGNGDFKSEECTKILKQADVIITNPPFSLFREFINILMEYKKDFIAVGNMNAITYKELFDNIKNNKIFLGVNNIKSFLEPCGQIKKFGNIIWYTSYPIRLNSYLELTQTYTEQKYHTYFNYDAINVDKVKDIPKDYYGKMGVPITFLLKYNPKQFKIIGVAANSRGKEIGVKDYLPEHKTKGLRHGTVYYIEKGKTIEPYKRIIIQRIKED